MTFRAAIPNTARNPTSEPIETFPSLSQVANTPPTSADGSVMKARIASRQAKTTCNTARCLCPRQSNR